MPSSVGTCQWCHLVTRLDRAAIASRRTQWLLVLPLTRELGEVGCGFLEKVLPVRLWYRVSGNRIQHPESPSVLPIIYGQLFITVVWFLYSTLLQPWTACTISVPVNSSDTSSDVQLIPFQCLWPSRTVSESEGMAASPASVTLAIRVNTAVKVSGEITMAYPSQKYRWIEPSTGFTIWYLYGIKRA